MDLLTLGLINKMRNSSGSSESSGNGGGGGGIVAFIEQESLGGSTYTSQLTPAEIGEYLNNGVPVSLYLKTLLSYSPGYRLYGLTYDFGPDGDGGLICSCRNVGMNGEHEPVIWYWLDIFDDGSVTALVAAI